MKHFLCVIVLLPMLVMGQSQFSLQDKPFIVTIPLDTELIQYVQSQIKGRGLTEEEKQFFYWSNYLRVNPKGFYTGVISPFLASFPEAKGKEAESLKRELLALSPLSRYRFSSQLADLAFEQASDLAENNNQISHTDSKGRSFAQRMKLGGVTKCAAENIYTGKNNGLLALIMLLLDIGLEPAGHRKNILNPNFGYMGISIRPHASGQRIILVQVFGCT